MAKRAICRVLGAVARPEDPHSPLSAMMPPVVQLMLPDDIQPGAVVRVVVQVLVEQLVPGEIPPMPPV